MPKGFNLLNFKVSGSFHTELWEKVFTRKGKKHGKIVFRLIN